MCGIAGYITTDPLGERALPIASAMADALQHRGPDDAGVWIDPQSGIGLAHRRLAILDLSPTGRQPMVSESGRYVIVYNGEVYNFPTLRTELESRGHHFRGRSDTEVMLASIEQWGLPRAIRRFVGMFAFALWDAKEHVLTLARDRLGVKPLYYGWVEGAFVFASELKAMRIFPGWTGDIDRNALALFFRHNCIPAPYSIYRGIYKLYPGTTLTLGREQARGSADFNPLPISEGKPRARLQPEAYWSVRTIACEAAENSFAEGDREAAAFVEQFLRDAVRSRLVSDVPLGVFLSGGLDSSTVAAFMQETGGRTRTFTIGFPDAQYDEAPYARKIATYLGTDHTEIYLTPEETLVMIPRMPEIYDEPFADSSQIPTHLVSRMARRHVTVCLSGDGGDEVFGGYNRYVFAPTLWAQSQRLPFFVRRGMARMIQALPIHFWEGLFTALRPLLPVSLRHRVPGDTLYKAADIITAPSLERAYRALTSHWKDPAELVLDASEPPTALTDDGRTFQHPDPVRRMMLTDLISYLPDDILTKVDRASMSVGLEVREPLLDHRLVEFTLRLPLNLLVRPGMGKFLLRVILYRRIPRRLLERPKYGFGLPLGRWLSGPLRDWCEALLDSQRLAREGFLSPAVVQKYWAEHISGRADRKHELWDILMFQGWLDAVRHSVPHGAR